MRTDYLGEPTKLNIKTYTLELGEQKRNKRNMCIYKWRPSRREEHTPSISHYYQRRAGCQTLALRPTSSHLPRGSSECMNHICHESSRCCDQM